MFGVKQKVADTAKRAGFLSGGLLLCLIGTAFLTVAGWLALEPIVGITLTATVIAGVYLGFGLIFIGIGASKANHTPQPAPVAQASQTPEGPPIVQAFLYGLQAGSTAERKRG